MAPCAAPARARTLRATPLGSRMEIQDDPENGAVVIDGRSVPGWIDDGTCPTCGNQRVYHIDRDAFFCPQSTFGWRASVAMLSARTALVDLRLPCRPGLLTNKRLNLTSATK